MGKREIKQAIKKLRLLIYDPSISIEKFRETLEQTFNSPFLPNRVEWAQETVEGVPCDILIPEVYSTERVMLYIHGGSFVGGSRSAWRSFCASLAHASCTKIIVPEIHLAPQHPYPAALEDLKALIKVLYTDKPQIIIGADGSGGSLAIALALSIKGSFRKKIADLVLFSPWLDLSIDSEAIKTPPKKNADKVLSPAALKSCAELYTYSANHTNFLVSPMFAAHDLLKQLPDVYIQIAQGELIEQDIIHFQDKLRKAGVSCILDIWPDMVHMFQMADDCLQEAHLAVEKAGKYIKNKPEAAL